MYVVMSVIAPVASRPI